MIPTSAGGVAANYDTWKIVQALPGTITTVNPARNRVHDWGILRTSPPITYSLRKPKRPIQNTQRQGATLAEHQNGESATSGAKIAGNEDDIR
jgi:hypothetical protein